MVLGPFRQELVHTMCPSVDRARHGIQRRMWLGLPCPNVPPMITRSFRAHRVVTLQAMVTQRSLGWPLLVCSLAACSSGESSGSPHAGVDGAVPQEAAPQETGSIEGTAIQDASIR